MKIRARLVLGLLCLLIILLSMGLYSINQCSELGGRIEASLKDHDQTGKIFQQMKHACQLMTGALLTRLAEDKVTSLKDFEAANRSFLDALNEESVRNLKDSREHQKVQQLSDWYHGYIKRCLAFLNAGPSPSSQLRQQALQLGRDTNTLIGALDDLIQAHEKDRDAKGTSSADDINRTIRTLILLMLIAVAVAIYASFRLSEGVLTPLRSLAESIQKIGEGSLDMELPVMSQDELGSLATSFNQMAARLRQYQLNLSEELTRLNQTVRATLASFPDPVFVLNSHGAIEFRNPEADQLAIKLLFSGVTRLPENLDRKVEEVRTTGKDYIPTLLKDAVKFHIDGQDRYFLPRIVLLRDEKEQPFGVAVIVANVTRMMLLDDLKSNLIATVSHELKTPLTSIRVTLYLLSEMVIGFLNPRQAELVFTARDDTDRLLRTLNDLLDLAKLEQGQPLDLRPISPGEIVAEAERSVKDLAALSGNALIANIEPGLPTVPIDRQRIAYVLTNLLTNAIKYSDKGGTIFIGVRMADLHGKPGIRFSVRDHGAGIPADHQEHIFKRFYRVPGTTKTGAGLGLSIAREVVMAHHGEIGVISEVNRGSEFFFIIPLPV